MPLMLSQFCPFFVATSLAISPNKNPSLTSADQGEQSVVANYLSEIRTISYEFM